jgi:hypothetical protein
MLFEAEIMKVVFIPSEISAQRRRLEVSFKLRLKRTVEFRQAIVNMVR